MLGRTGTHTVDDQAERLQVGGATLPQLIRRAQRTVGSRDGEQAGLGHYCDSVARRPRRAGQTVEAGRTVDEDEPVAFGDPSEGILEPAQIALGQRRPIEFCGTRRTGDHIEVAEPVADPPGRDDRLGQDLLGLRSSEHIGDVDTRRGRHIKAGRRVRLRVHVDDQGGNPPVVGRRGQTERHGCLTDSAFEAADT